MGKVVFMGGFSSAYIKRELPYHLIERNEGEKIFQGFNGLFCQLFLMELDKYHDGAFSKIFSEEIMTVPKSQLHRLKRGVADEAVYIALLDMMQRGQFTSQVHCAAVDLVLSMAQNQWKHSAKLMHGLFFWLGNNGEIFQGDIENMTPEQMALHNTITQTSIEVVERIMDAPHLALKMVEANPQYLVLTG